MSDPYWTLDTSLFGGTFRYFGKEPVLVRGKVHTEKERSTKSDVHQEVTPLAITSGERSSLHMRPFALIPDVMLTVGLSRDPERSGALGEVVKRQERKMKEVEIGNMQAWSYPDNTLMLWGAFSLMLCAICLSRQTQTCWRCGNLSRPSWSSRSPKLNGSSRRHMTPCLTRASTSRC